MRGNVLDMAVGVIIGGAFGKIVSSLVADIIMPLIGCVVGGVRGVGQNERVVPVDALGGSGVVQGQHRLVGCGGEDGAIARLGKQAVCRGAAGRGKRKDRP